MEAITQRRLELLLSNPDTRPHDGGVLIVDETSVKKDGTKTDHVARQYLGSLGKVDNGIVSVSTVWADERLYYPLHVAPYTPAARLRKGEKDPAFRTKPQLAMQLVDAALSRGGVPGGGGGLHLRGERALEGALASAGLPYVLALRPSKGHWAPAEEPHTPQEAARELRWEGPSRPGDWKPVVRRFRDEQHREVVGGGDHLGPLRPRQADASGGRHDRPQQVAQREHLVSGHQPARPGLATGTRMAGFSSGPGRGGAALRIASLGGAELQAGEAPVGLGRLPGAALQGDPQTLGIGLLRLLLLLVGLVRRRPDGLAPATHGDAVAPRPGHPPTRSGGAGGRRQRPGAGPRPARRAARRPPALARVAGGAALRPQLAGALDQSLAHLARLALGDPAPELRWLLDLVGDGYSLHLYLRL